MKLLIALSAILIGLAAAALLIRVEYALLPATGDLLNPGRYEADVAYDVFGKAISRAEADDLLNTEDGRKRLSAAQGAVRVDDELRRLGRQAFYRETFGNEWFMTDVLGLTEGALTPFRVAKAVLKLGGRGTSNLLVEVAETVSIGGRVLEKGSTIATGIDVPRGSFAPLGMKVVYDPRPHPDRRDLRALSLHRRRRDRPCGRGSAQCRPCGGADPRVGDEFGCLSRPRIDQGHQQLRH
jgi:hypothetical protein